VQLDQLPLEELQTLQAAFEADVSSVWDFHGSVEKKDVVGGTSKRAVLEQVHKMRAWLDETSCVHV